MRSLRTRTALLLCVLLCQAFLLYSIFARGEAEQRELLVTAVQDAGTAIAAGLAPELRDLQPDGFDTLDARLARFADPRRSITLLFRPLSGGAENQFFFVAGAPSVPASEVEGARARLAALGVLPALARSCAGDTPLAERVPTGTTGTTESVITSITGVAGSAGCWAIVVAVKAERLRSGIDGRPPWLRGDVQLAAAIYAVMGTLILLIFGSVRANLQRFRMVAQAPTESGGFLAVTDVPEIAPVAHAIDTMVERLRGTAETLRQAAEANAHALKGPIATIRQATEPLLGTTPAPERLQAALTAVTASLDRLDGLVRSARRLDTATADLLEIGNASVDLSALLEGLIADCRAMRAADDLRVVADLTPQVRVRGEADAVESIVENLLDNAASFSPTGGEVRVRLQAQGTMATMTVEDEGPGVPQSALGRIFDRYYTDRRAAPRTEAESAHFGIGLWLARQNARALGGDIEAANRTPHGLMVTMRLPLERSLSADPPPTDKGLLAAKLRK